MKGEDGIPNDGLIRIYGTHAGNAGEAQMINLQINLDYTAVPAVTTHNNYMIPQGWALVIMHAQWDAAGVQNIYLRFGQSVAAYNNANNPIQHDWRIAAAGVDHDDYVRGEAKKPIYEFVLEAVDYDYYLYLSIDQAQLAHITLLCKLIRLSDL